MCVINVYPPFPFDVVTRLCFIASPAAQAGTLIHEATHVLSDTGDYVRGKAPGKIIPGSDPATSRKMGCKPLLDIPWIVLTIKFRHKVDGAV